VTPTAGGTTAAAIDIGSNSLKMTVGKPDGKGGVEQIAWASEVMRLGEGVEATGRLDERRMDSALDALRRFADQARDLGATRVVAVATDATRSATNGETFLEEVRKETGIEVRVIDGDEEAALTFRGLAASMDLSGPVLIADIGGGSTELIAAVDGELKVARSIGLGSGRLTERLVRSDPPTEAELAVCEAEAARTIADGMRALDLPAETVKRLVLVGGTGEYMARLLPDDRGVDLPAVRQILDDLTTVAATELAVRIGAPEARVRVLPAGVAIVMAIASNARPDSIEISHSGVRAGLLLETFEALNVPDKQRLVVGTGSENSVKRSDASRTTPATPDAESADDGAGFRETMTDLIAERWDAVWEAIPVALAGENIEGVHDVRVASRRLRAAMDVATPVFPRPWYKALHRTAKEITGALGEVRDRDVLLEALRADREGAPLVERPGIDRLIDRVEQERAEARLEMEAYLRELLNGAVRGETERRFGARPSDHEPAASGQEPQ
jgi:exopolyphosphatase/pppGpp-phosphohydrolase